MPALDQRGQVVLRYVRGSANVDRLVHNLTARQDPHRELGHVVYGAGEDALLALTGDHPENPTLALPCREVFARGQKVIGVTGPVPEVADEMIETHRGFWAARGR